MPKTKLDKTDRDFLRPDFDRKRQMGERAVGQVAQVGDGDKLKQRVDSASLEGDDVGVSASRSFPAALRRAAE